VPAAAPAQASPSNPRAMVIPTAQLMTAKTARATFTETGAFTISD
jgi:hypothetical protein